MSRPRKLDVASLLSIDANKATLTIETPEDPEERDSRLRVAEQQAAHERWRVTITHFITLGTFVLGVLAIVAICLTLLLRRDTTEKIQHRATVGLSSVLSGAVGYLADRPRG